MRTLGITLLFVVAFTVVAAIVTATWRMVAPGYTCSAILEARPEPTSAASSVQQGYVTMEMLEVLATKYASLAGSEPVLQTALAKDEVRATTWFQNSLDDALERLTNELNCYPLPGSALIVVSMTGEHKTELPDIVNAVANAARERSSEISNRGKQDQIHQLRQERTSLADTRDRIRADKAKLLRDAQVPDLTNSVYDSELRRMAEAVLSAELEFSEAEVSIGLIRQQIQNGNVSSLPQVVQFIERDPVVCGLLMRHAEILAELARARQVKRLPDSIPSRPRVTLPPEPKEPAEVAPPDKAVTRPSDANAMSVDEAGRALEELQKALQGLVPAATQPSRGDSKASDSKPRQEAESDRPGRAPTKGPSGEVGPTTSPDDGQTRPAGGNSGEGPRWIYDGVHWVRARPANTQPTLAGDASDPKSPDTRPPAKSEQDLRAPTKGPSGVVGPTTSQGESQTSPAGGDSGAGSRWIYDGVRWVQARPADTQPTPASDAPQDDEDSSVSGLLAGLEAVTREIEDRRLHLVKVSVEAMLTEAEGRKANALCRLTELRQKYRLLDVSARDVRATLSAYAQLEEQDKTLTDQINPIDRRLVDLRILLSGNAPLEVMQLAYTPLEPSFPRLSVMVPAGAGTGLALGLLVSLTLHLPRRRRATAEPPASN